MPSYFEDLTFPSWITQGYRNFLNPDIPYRDAAKEAAKGYNTATGYLNPYYQGGLDQYGRLNTATGQLLNPAELENQWIQSYETSPYAKQALAQNQTAGMDVASFMGLMGSSAALQNIQQGAGQIQQQDREKYLNDLMNKYLAGIGLGHSLYGTGAQAGGALSNLAFKEGENIAGLKYGEEAAPSKMFGNIFGAGMNLYKPGSGNAFMSNQGGNNLNAGNQYNTGR